MKQKNDAELLALATELAGRAAAAILKIREEGFAVERKSDASPVTAADRAAEELIVAGLREEVPDIPVVAEEEVEAGRVTEAAPSFWLVDPLDGTREFAAGRDEFAVNVGLVRDGRPYLGAVALPATGEIYLGIVGTGAWRQDPAGKRQPIYVRTPPETGLDVMASRHYADDPRLAAFLKGRKIASVTNIGSAMKFCRLAEGKADLYPRLGRTMEWDTAAPQAVLEAAGGHVLTLEGTPLGYGKPGWENPPFICTGK
ncbi:MAG TPA: 3'(2'),5'-bisphosphate nucleotidase CysQ [Acetobacteraceae bacterium]|nr:3'(2'),5'-bisphosphate nucleotidase CysQ [Acetobacteraceae bacterium]